MSPLRRGRGLVRGGVGGVWEVAVEVAQLRRVGSRGRRGGASGVEIVNA